MLSDTAAKSTDTIKKPASLLLLHKEAYKQDRGHQIIAVIIACPWHMSHSFYLSIFIICSLLDPHKVIWITSSIKEEIPTYFTNGDHF